MGWCTDLFCNVSFNRETFNSKRAVENKLEETRNYLQTAKDHLRNFVMMTEPQKFCPEDYDPMSWINNECQDWLDSIEEYTIECYKLELLLENWDNCHDENGLAISPPDNIDWNTAYMDGDFVRSTKRPNADNIPIFKNE